MHLRYISMERLLCVKEACQRKLCIAIPDTLEGELREGRVKRLWKSETSKPFMHQQTKCLLFVSISLSFYTLIYYAFSATSSLRSYTISTRQGDGGYLTLNVVERCPQEINNTVVLLYTEKSCTWEKLNTLKLLCNSGYRAIGLKLPGHGTTVLNAAPKDYYEKAFILETALQKLEATNAVLVAPAFSGSYALPLVLRGDMRLKGFVPISPHAADKYQRSEYTLLSTPTMTIFGTETVDNHVVDLLSAVPGNKIHYMRDERSASYVQNSRTFHNKLLTFLRSIKSGLYISSSMQASE